MYATAPDTFEKDIKRLEQLYTARVIVKCLGDTKENISNKGCSSVAKRYKVEPFLRCHSKMGAVSQASLKFGKYS